MHLTRNQTYSQGYRGFESLPLRHKISRINSRGLSWAPVLFGMSLSFVESMHLRAQKGTEIQIQLTRKLTPKRPKRLPIRGGVTCLKIINPQFHHNSLVMLLLMESKRVIFNSIGGWHSRGGSRVASPSRESRKDEIKWRQEEEN